MKNKIVALSLILLTVVVIFLNSVSNLVNAIKFETLDLQISTLRQYTIVGGYTVCIGLAFVIYLLADMIVKDVNHYRDEKDQEERLEKLKDKIMEKIMRGPKVQEHFTDSNTSQPTDVYSNRPEVDFGPEIHGEFETVENIGSMKGAQKIAEISESYLVPKGTPIRNYERPSSGLYVFDKEYRRVWIDLHSNIAKEAGDDLPGIVNQIYKRYSEDHTINICNITKCEKEEEMNDNHTDKDNTFDKLMKHLDNEFDKNSLREGVRDDNSKETNEFSLKKYFIDPKKEKERRGGLGQDNSIDLRKGSGENMNNEME